MFGAEPPEHPYKNIGLSRQCGLADQGWYIEHYFREQQKDVYFCAPQTMRSGLVTFDMVTHRVEIEGATDISWTGFDLFASIVRIELDFISMKNNYDGPSETPSGYGFKEPKISAFGLATLCRIIIEGQ